MYIINKIELPNNRVRVLQVDNNCLELCTYPKSKLPNSTDDDLSNKFKLDRYNNQFKFGDFAEGTISGHKVYYNSCNPLIRSMLTKSLNCYEGSRFKSV